MSLGTKLALALLLTSFAAMAVVGLTVRRMALDRSDDLVGDRAAEAFADEVADVNVRSYRRYGYGVVGRKDARAAWTPPAMYRTDPV